jgi:hypothetical protein
MRRTTLACAGVALALAAVAGSAPTAQAATTGARADWSAGAVGRWTGYVRAGGSRRVREVQRRLARLGYRLGRVDGLFGSRTESATIRFQRRNGLAPDGLVGRRTLRAIRTRDDTRLSARQQVEQPRAEQSPAPQPPEPPPASRVPEPLSDAAPPARDVPWLAIGLLAAIVAAGLLAVAAHRRRRPGGPQPIETTPRRELVAQAETSLPPRFTRSAQRRALGVGRRERD